MIAAGFSWFRVFPWVDQDEGLKSAGWAESFWGPEKLVANTAIHAHAWVTVAIVIVVALVARRALEQAKARPGLERYTPHDRFSVLTIVELLASAIRHMMGDLLDRSDVRAFFPLVAGLFTYILVSNLQGLFPGFLPPTGDVHANTGMALLVFVVFNIVGLARDAKGYIKHLMGPILLLAPFMLPLEVMSLCIRPVTLTVRLTANLFGDHQLYGAIASMVPFIVPMPLLLLATMVSLVQALVFSLLTTIYVHLSLPHGDHDH